MKTTVLLPTVVEVGYIRLALPVRYGDEDIPYNFPLRDGDSWRAIVDIDSGRVLLWPKGKSGKLSMKVCDEGTYVLLSPSFERIAEIKQGYVPHGVVPGEYGDYIELEINEDGIITNWPKRPDVSAFFNRTED